MQKSQLTFGNSLDTWKMSSVLFRAKLNQLDNGQEVCVHFSTGDIEAMTSCAKPTMEKRRKFTSRPSTTSAQTRMSTSDLRGVGISAPTGFVHVSGYNRTFQRCGSVSEASCSSAIASGDKIKNELLLMSSQHQKHRDHSRSRMRELSNIDPKFTSQSGLCSSSELETSRGSIRIQHLTASSTVPTSTANTTTGSNVGLLHSGENQSRFPRLQSCAHFHYEFTDIGPILIELLSEDDELKSLPATKNENHSSIRVYSVQVTSHAKTWTVRRSYENFEFLDRQAHQCIFDRKYSQLPVIPQEENVIPNNGQSHKDSVRQLLSSYLHRFSTLAGPVITCGPVLNWLELDNRGHRLIVTDDCAINTPAVAAAYAIKRYAKQASDEISFEVGDMISVIDMPPPDESIWWRGKRGFEVGFFPCECVEVIGDKVPQGLNLPLNSTRRIRKNSMGSDENQDADTDTGGSPTCSSTEQQPSKPVLRKHGKLISFFRSFILSRPARGKLKKSGILKERVFGCDLSEHLLNTGQDVPKVLTHCAEFIEARGIIDGIYRLPGIASNIQKLRVAFDEDRVPNLYDDRTVLQDIYSVSSLLKMYFRELPNPVCTYHLYDKFVEAAKAPENTRLVLMRDVVQQLPPPNYRTLEYLARHLYRVSLRGNDTGMTAKNVAICWAPNLLRAKSLETGGVAALQGVGVQAVVTEYLIRYCELIFSDKMPSYNTSSNPAAAINEDAVKKLRPKSLAISTPTKLLSLEEARNRVQHNLGPVGNVVEQAPQKYIEVGGGPKSLPQKYHTVIDLPGRRSMKQRKSPIGWKAIFKSKGNKTGASRKEDLITNGQNETVTDDDLRTAMPRALLRPVKSAESLVTAGTVQRSQSERRTSKAMEEEMDKSMMESHDDLCPLETVSKAVAAANIMKDSPRTHSRSNSHDSYFERKLQMEQAANKDSKMDSSLDLSEIQVNFDLEENEMKIFSEDEAMMTNSFDGSDDFSKSPLEEHPPKASSTPPPPPIAPAKDRKMSFREKFKRFTSPTQNRKEINCDSDNQESTSADSHHGDTPPREPKNNANKTEMTLRERIVCALSPESLRKRVDNQQATTTVESSPKKKKSSFSPGTSPSNTSQLIKRSKIEDQQPERETIPLSPSINFIDASMTESFESTSKLPTSDNQVKLIENPRFSTTSSGVGDTDEQQMNQLVIAQVHHDPILEMRQVENHAAAAVTAITTDDDDVSYAKDKETDSLEDNKDDQDDEENKKEGENNTTESYSIAGATISENESFSLASDEDMQATTQQSSTSDKTHEESNLEEAAQVESTLTATMLPANHVIQYSPQRTASKGGSDWSPHLQLYEEPMDIDRDDVTNDNVNACHEPSAFSCPIFPRPSSLVTTAQVQLDHDQNLHFAGEEDVKGDINNPQATPTTKTPSPKPRNSKKQNSSSEMDAGTAKPRGPVPTPRKSVTVIDMPSDQPRSSSAMSKKISFESLPPKKKLSTFSLHNTTTAEDDEGSNLTSDLMAEQMPLQRRNSIHNVPYVDVNDPQTRQRMERYKEERRSMLRAKYKVEDYMTSENKYRRRSTETKDSADVSVTTEELIPVTMEVTLRKNSSPIREDGLIDEDVNVKERAAIFGGSCGLALNQRNAKSWSSSNNNKRIAVPSRPLSDSNHRKLSPGSPSKIRDMAAFFEQQKNQ